MQFSQPKWPVLIVWVLIALATETSRIALAEDPLPDVSRLQSSPVLQHLKPNPMATPPRTPAEQTVAQMYLPEGFRAELIAAEPDLHQPVAFTFDERGRLWVVEAYSYPQKRPAGEGLDKIVIFEDEEGNGQFKKRKVFAENLNLVSGIEVGFGGVWVGAAPELLFIPDRDHDDRPDGPAEVLLDGFGYQDTHECLNSFLWGPDGWLYGNQGVFNYARIGRPGTSDAQRIELRAGVWRYHPVRHQFEVFAEGGSNQWGLDYDDRGQIFMTHCRSYWGRGCTTHVIQGGQYWNQANANYAPFIVANPPADFPQFRNFMLAAARYDHGAGGAGKPGSDAIYGGHSHVGTMIYLGDNWPDSFRGHLFTHNLGGHQINHQINRRLGSGFETVHAGQDQFFCSDPKYVAVDLQYGPDGAVYVIDWYDRQHCHNPNTERWDRSNGRIYRIQYSSAYKPVKVDLNTFSDADLAFWTTHKNEWYVRIARRLLHERSLTRRIDPKAKAALVDRALKDGDPAQRLRGIWTLHAIGAFSNGLAGRCLSDKDEFVRGWAIQLLAEDDRVPSRFARRFLRMAAVDPSPVVRLYLACAMQRLPENLAWQVAEALSQHGEDREDRNLPLVLWDGIARRLTNPAAFQRAFAMAQKTKLPQLADFVYWYAGTFDGEPLNATVALLGQARDELLRRRLAGLGLALSGRANVGMPPAWSQVAPALYAHSDTRVQRQAEEVAAVFGDNSMFPRLREALSNSKSSPELRKHAFKVLSRALDRASLPVFLELLDDAAFRSATISLLGRFDAPEIPKALTARFQKLRAADRSAALNTLTSRAPFAVALLDAVAAGEVPRDQITAFHVRQMGQLGNQEVDRRVTAAWGRISQTPAEKQTEITKLEKIFNEAPLWAYDGRAGKDHFQKLCAQCHRLGNDGTRLGPELTGAGKNGIRYYLENILDPNAVIGTDFQMTTVETKGGDLLSGLVVNESGSALTLRTTAGEMVLAKSDISRLETSEKSLMPEGLLEAMGERERIELLKFLTEH
jgi:putative membrane-bound dehydrogenase-like protein